MRLEETLSQVEQKVESNLRKRFACSNCGNTWVEIVGLLTADLSGQENVYFRLGDESENCRICKHRIRTCPTCGSNDAYEINFPSNAKESPLSFSRIRIVSKA
jgi:hypothetical protein